MILNTVSQEQLQIQLNGLKIVILTETEYNAILIKDDKTLYLIKED